jgi:hypothetical protein
MVSLRRVGVSQLRRENRMKAMPIDIMNHHVLKVSRRVGMRVDRDQKCGDRCRNDAEYPFPGVSTAQRLVVDRQM